MPSINRRYQRAALFLAHKAFVFLLCLIAGILLDNAIPFGAFPFLGILGAAALSLTGWVVLRRSRWRPWAWVALVLALILTASLYAHARRIFPEDHIFFHYRPYLGKAVPVRGVVVSDVIARQRTKGPKTTFVLSVSTVAGQPHSGRVLVNIYRSQELTYGDEVVLAGKLHRPFDFGTSRKFSYRKYLLRKKTPLILSVKKKAEVEIIKDGFVADTPRNDACRNHASDDDIDASCHCERPQGAKQASFLMAGALRLRRGLKDILFRHLPHDQAGIMAAILLGDRTGLAPDIYDLFKKTGTAHVLAISGLHVGIITAMMLTLWKFLLIPRRMSYVLTMLILTGYPFVTGARASVVRAVIMANVFLGGLMWERESVSLNTLVVAAALILLMNPPFLFDIGFQLSFISVLFILWLFPVLKSWCARCPWYDQTWFRVPAQSACVSLAAWFGVSGLCAYYFDILTPVSLLANLVVVPLLAVVVALGLGVLLIGGLLGPNLTWPLADVLMWILKIMVTLVAWASRIPYGSITLPEFPLLGAWIYYAVWIGGWGMLRWRRRWQRGQRVDIFPVVR